VHIIPLRNALKMASSLYGIDHFIGLDNHKDYFFIKVKAASQKS
jgi:hypothetical protein